MNPPRSHKTTAGATYLDLQATARATCRPVDELFQFYALEGFLRRLTRTSHADNFVLKGGVLLAAYSGRRPTRDVDLADRRQVTIRPLAQILDGYADLAQAQWSGWRRRQALDTTPEAFAELLDQVVSFADPILADLVDSTART